MELLRKIDMQGGIDASAPLFSPQSQSTLDAQSWNTIVSGSGLTRPWSGVTSFGSGTGSEKMVPYADTWGGIKASSGLAAGSFFQDIGKSRWGIGQGTPHIEGTNATGWTLTNSLQLQLSQGGSYGTVYTAGLAQPNAPTLAIHDFTGPVSGTISCKIERTRPATGARSVASPSSAIVTCVNQQVKVTFPAAVSGQTHWRVYFTFQGFGGTGIHYLCQYRNGSSIFYDIPEDIGPIPIPGNPISGPTVQSGDGSGGARTLAFSFKDGDLLPVEASFDDYPPPRGTHAIRIANVMNVIGCYADSSDPATPTSSAPGTAIAVSKENNYESYVPTSLLFLPEPVVDAMARQVDDYGYIGCKNSIHALQYIGNRSAELPSCTLTTILPDLGIEYAQNWCQFRGRLLIYAAPGNLLMMDESGNWDTSFAAPVSKLLKTFSTSTTVLGYDAKNDSIVVFCGLQALVYSLQRQQWRRIWMSDFGTLGTVAAAVTAKRDLFFSNGVHNSVFTAYSYDTGSATAPVTVCCNYQMESGAIVQDILEMALSVQTGVAQTLAVAINTRLAKTVFRRIAIGNGSFDITNVETGDDAFTADMVGKKVAILKAGILGGSTFVLTGKVASVSGSTLTLSNASPYTAPQVTDSDVLMLVGDFIGTTGGARGGLPKHTPNFFPYIAEARSYQVAVGFQATGQVGNVLDVDLLGQRYSSTRAF